MAAETNLLEQKWIKKTVFCMAGSASKTCQIVLSTRTKLIAFTVPSPKQAMLIVYNGITWTTLHEINSNSVRKCRLINIV